MLSAIVAFHIWNSERPSYVIPDETAPKSRSNLREIGQMILLYSNDSKARYGPYPDSFGTLLAWDSDFKYDYDAYVFVSPYDNNSTPAQGATTQAMVADFNSGGHCSYVYLGKGFDASIMYCPDVVIAYEPMALNPGGGMNVLFADGHVGWVNNIAAKSISTQAARGISPVRWPVPAN